MFCTTGNAKSKMCVLTQVTTARPRRTISPAVLNIHLCMRAGRDIRTRSSIQKPKSHTQSHKATHFFLTTKMKTTMGILQTSHYKAKGIMGKTDLPVKLQKESR